MPASDRPHDLVLLGATGFTGGLTAEYLARHAPAETGWALAGRNREKLERRRALLAEIEPRCADLPLLEADVTDAASLRALAASTRVVATTVGPYAEYGDPLVAACAAEGTDYADITGEPEFVDRTYVRHHATAEANGARLVHCCGFDSIPHDLGVLFTVEQLPEDVPLRVRGYVRAGGRPSGGTFHSAMGAFARARQTLAAGKERGRLEPRPEGRRVKGDPGRPGRDATIGAYVLPLPTIDPQIVLRSARALPRYGPDFTYGHFAAVESLPVALAAPAGVAGLFAAAQVPPLRKALLGRLQPGDGPPPHVRAKSWFEVRFVGEGGGRRVVTKVSGADPGYDETAKMLAESALCLAHDDLPARAGQLTPAAAMGDHLIRRLDGNGRFRFEVLEGAAAGSPAPAAA